MKLSKKKTLKKTQKASWAWHIPLLPALGGGVEAGCQTGLHMRLSQGKFYHEKLDLVSNFEISIIKKLYSMYKFIYKYLAFGKLIHRIQAISLK